MLLRKQNLSPMCAYTIAIVFKHILYISFSTSFSSGSGTMVFQACQQKTYCPG